jgi:hypothetical protein
MSLVSNGDSNEVEFQQMLKLRQQFELSSITMESVKKITEEFEIAK